MNDDQHSTNILLIVLILAVIGLAGVFVATFLLRTGQENQERQDIELEVPLPGPAPQPSPEEQGQ